MEKKKKIAIVGSGISGIGTLYALRQSGHEVHLYESQNRLGGHTNTVLWKHNATSVAVDTGFIVLNTATYPNFIAFLKELGVETVPTDMTFGISRDGGVFEWSGTSLDSIFAQRENLLRPSFWRMIFDIVRFNLFALDILTDVDGTIDNKDDQSIGEYLDREGYSSAFRDDYLIPMTACVWSTGPDKCALEFPAVTLIRFMWNHHLLSTIAKRPDWLTIPGGSKRYIDAVMKDFPPSQLHLSTAAKALRNGQDGKVILTFENGREETFDDVVLACHGDEAFDIISGSATDKEKSILSAFQTTPNKIYLHSDLSLMPRRRKTWSSWNYLTSSAAASPGAPQTVSLTYNMNILQHLPASQHSHILVTMNPPRAPDPSLVQHAGSYAHPLYTAAAVAAQSRLAEVQGARGVWFAGAWTGYGFHEDGLESGVAVAERLGGGVPWARTSAKFARGRTPVLGSGERVARLVVGWVQWMVVLVEWVWRMGRGKGGKAL